MGLCDNFVEGIVDCFGKAASMPEQATFRNHGTTLVIDAFIQRRGAKAALVAWLLMLPSLQIEMPASSPLGKAALEGAPFACKI